MIDHTGHPHPSTPKARALCRANGGTGFIGKIGGNAPVADKKDNGAKKRIPSGPVDVTPKEPKTINPPVQKKPTVPKDHGVPKPPTPPRKKPPEPPTAKPVPGGNTRTVTPKNFNPKTMQIKDGNGNWRDVPSEGFTKGPGGGSRSGGARGGQYAFRDEKGNLIQRASPNEKITVRDKPTVPGPDLPRLPPPNIAGTMSVYIPPATGNSPSAKIQNALRRGASRDFIVARSKSSPVETNREIDRILTSYGVPNHVYPRKGSGKPAPNIKDVTPAPKVPKPDTVDSPNVVVNTIGLNKVRDSVNVDSRIKETVHKVLDVQAGHVGGKITRIKAVDNDLPDPDTPIGKHWGIGAGTLAVCTHEGRIHLHKDLHEKEKVVNYSMNSGWFTKGGTGVEQTIAHEMGHAFLNEAQMTPAQRQRVANALFTTFGLTNPFGTNPPTWYSGLLDRVVAHPDNKVKVKRLVSKYGATNASELMAEVWSEYTMNPNPRPRIKKLGDVLKSIIAEGAK